MNCLADDRAVAAAKPHVTDITAEDWRGRDGPGADIRVSTEDRKTPRSPVTTKKGLSGLAPGAMQICVVLRRRYGGRNRQNLKGSRRFLPSNAGSVVFKPHLVRPCMPFRRFSVVGGIGYLIARYEPILPRHLVARYLYRICFAVTISDGTRGQIENDIKRAAAVGAREGDRFGERRDILRNHQDGSKNENPDQSFLL